MRRSLIVVGVILLFIVMIIFVIARGGESPQQKTEVAKQTSLVDYADTTTEMRFTVEGKVNARENHRVIQIHVGRDYRSITIFEGYQGTVLRQQSYLNDRNAYNTFLAAINNQGYTKTREAARGVDSQGACALGRRFRYDIIEGSDTKQSLWSTSCRNADGTFAGRSTQVRQLFEAQIPNYNELTNGIQL
jgi:hypothetical protein